MKKNYQKPQSAMIILLPSIDLLGTKVGSVISGGEHNPLYTE